MAFSNPGTDRTLTLTGDNTNTGFPSILALTIGDAGAGKVGITKTGPGAWFLGANSTNTYSGPTSVQGGNLALAPTGGSANSAYTVAAGAELWFRSTGSAIGSLAGAGTVQGAPASVANVQIGGDGTSTTFSGVIQDGSGVTSPLKLTKVGTGTLTLSGPSSYTGTTTINSGTLRVNGSLAAGSAVTVNNGGTLGGTGVVNGTLTVNSGGTVAPGASIGTLTASSTTLNGGGVLAFEYNPATLVPVAGVDNDLLLGLTGATLDLAGLSSGNRFNIVVTATGSGTVRLETYRFAQFDTITGAAAEDVSNIFNVTGDFYDTPIVTLTQDPAGADYLTVTFASVPEPSTVMLLSGVGLGVAVYVRRRRRVMDAKLR